MRPYSGGFKGFDKTIWEVTEYNNGDNPSITFKYYSKDGEEGTVTVNFFFELRISLFLLKAKFTTDLTGYTIFLKQKQ